MGELLKLSIGLGTIPDPSISTRSVVPGISVLFVCFKLPYSCNVQKLRTGALVVVFSVFTHTKHTVYIKKVWQFNTCTGIPYMNSFIEFGI